MRSRRSSPSAGCRPPGRPPASGSPPPPSPLPRPAGAGGRRGTRVYAFSLPSPVVVDVPCAGVRPARACGIRRRRQPGRSSLVPRSSGRGRPTAGSSARTRKHREQGDQGCEDGRPRAGARGGEAAGGRDPDIAGRDPPTVISRAVRGWYHRADSAPQRAPAGSRPPADRARRRGRGARRDHVAGATAPTSRARPARVPAAPPPGSRRAGARSRSAAATPARRRSAGRHRAGHRHGQRRRERGGEDLAERVEHVGRRRRRAPGRTSPAPGPGFQVQPATPASGAGQVGAPDQVQFQIHVTGAAAPPSRRPADLDHRPVVAGTEDADRDVRVPAGRASAVGTTSTGTPDGHHVVDRVGDRRPGPPRAVGSGERRERSPPATPTA